MSDRCTNAELCDPSSCCHPRCRESQQTLTREGVQVKVGQVWRDLDKRMGNRERMVVAIEGDRAVMGFPWEPGRLAGRTKVLINRMHGTSQGWALLRDVE